MSEAMRHFKIISLIVAMIPFAGNLVGAEPASEIKKNETGFYRDAFDQSVYYEGTSFLHLERFGRWLKKKKVSALNVNVFDEVPDSAYFTNRHAKQKLTMDELEKGATQNAGPDLSGSLTVIDGEAIGTIPSFTVKDSKGDIYFLRFDPFDYPEMATAAEVIASRFYHALGYNVPEINIVTFDPSKLVVESGTTIVKNSGFRKALSQPELEDIFLLIPQNAEGMFRASVTKKISAEDKGHFHFDNRRSADKENKIPHQDRRELRSLVVFASWLNQYDMREGATQAVVDGSGKSLKYFLRTFETAFGSAGDIAKPPMAGHEYLVDYADVTKALFAFGLWEKPWEKRWTENGKELTQSAAIGYFDNKNFSPDKFKTQLPYYAFKDLSRADAFWAAKLIVSFTKEDIAAMVKAGRLSSPEDADLLTQLLIERKDIIVKHWFSQTAPLDDFSLSGGQLTFKDLAVDLGHQAKDSRAYKVDFLQRNGVKLKKQSSAEVQNSSVTIPNGVSAVNISVNGATPKASVLIEFSQDKISSIQHAD